MRTFQQTISARAGDGYKIHVAFADGTNGVFDFSPYLEYPCYEPLREGRFSRRWKRHMGRFHGRAKSTLPPKRMG